MDQRISEKEDWKGFPDNGVIIEAEKMLGPDSITP
jgi:hypothetical protein